jgi:hypothetical protein
MANNNRIFYAIQQVNFKSTNAEAYVLENVGHGVQSVGVNTNFNLEQVFELGQIAIYENIEEIPDVEVTMNKVLDGYPLLYHLATKGTATTSPTLSGRQNTRSFVAMSIFADTLDSATGTPGSIMECSGMYVSSIGYNFPLDDNFSEDVSFVGNDVIWAGDTNIVEPVSAARRDALSVAGFFDNNDAPLATVGVNRRQDLILGVPTGAVSADSNGAVDDPDYTVLPPNVFGMTSSGTNEIGADGNYPAHLSNISVSVDLGREEILELGRRAPYHRFATFPVEVTCEVEVTSSSGTMVSATEAGILTTSTAVCADAGNLTNGTIRIATCEGTRIYLGTKNKLASVNYGGGDAGGGNVSVSYTFTNFNICTVMHSGDPHASGTTWWDNRATNLYLTEA